MDADCLLSHPLRCHNADCGDCGHSFRQPKAPADAERSLQTKETKKSREDVRIAGNKIERAMGKLADLKRAEGRGRDSRMFSGVYASVIVSEGGKVTIKPMHYLFDTECKCCQ